MKRLMIFFIIFFFSSVLEGTENKASLQVKVEGLRSSSGWVVCHLFNGPDGYPTNSKKALKFINDFDLEDGIAEFTFYNLPPGEYAFTVHHDENGNKKMDKKLLGLPNEGWACSNDAKGALGIGVPSFDKAKFSVGDTLVLQVIEINY